MKVVLVAGAGGLSEGCNRRFKWNWI